MYLCMYVYKTHSQVPHHKNSVTVGVGVLGTGLCTYNIEVFVCWSLWRGLQFCDVDSRHAGVPPSFWWLQGMQHQGPGSYKARSILVTHGDVLCVCEVPIWASPYNLRDHCQSSHHCYCACHHKLSPPHYSTVIRWKADLDCGPGLGNCMLNTNRNAQILQLDYRKMACCLWYPTYFAQWCSLSPPAHRTGFSPCRCTECYDIQKTLGSVPRSVTGCWICPH